MRGLCHTACAWTLMTSHDLLPGGLRKQPQGPHEARSAAPDTDSEPEALPPAAGHCRLEASALSYQHTCHERAPMSPADTPQARPGQSGGLRQQAAPPGPRRRVVLQCLGYWGELWGGGPTPVAQRRVTTPAQGHRHQVCRHTHATHACTQLPNTLRAPPTSTRATLLEQACTHAGGILGSGSRTPSPHHGASFQPVGGCQGGEQLVQRCQRHRETGAGGRAGGERSIQGGRWGRRRTSPVGWASSRGMGRGPDAGSGMPGSPVAGPGAEQRPWRA